MSDFLLLRLDKYELPPEFVPCCYGYSQSHFHVLFSYTWNTLALVGTGLVAAVLADNFVILVGVPEFEKYWLCFPLSMTLYT